MQPTVVSNILHFTTDLSYSSSDPDPGFNFRHVMTRQCRACPPLTSKVQAQDMSIHMVSHKHLRHEETGRCLFQLQLQSILGDI
jgi:hypothetical protein